MNYSKITFVAALLLSLVFATADAQDFVRDGLGYTFCTADSQSVELVYADSLETGSLEVPAWVAANDSVNCRVVAVGDSALAGRLDLTRVTLPESLLRIGASAFEGCTALDSLVLPAGLEAIDSMAFAGCTGLTCVRPLMTTPFAIAESVFAAEVYSQAILQVSRGQLPSYQATAAWNQFANIVALPNYLEINDTTVVASNALEMPIMLVNDVKMAGLQFDVCLPEGLSFATDSTGAPVVSLASRTKGMQVSGNMISDSVARFTLFRDSVRRISGTSGPVATLSIQTSEDMAGGDYIVSLRDVILTTNDYQTIYADSVSATVTVEELQMGDVNADGEVDVTDVVTYVRYLLDFDVRVFVHKVADMNADGEENITDVVLIVNKILDSPQEAKSMLMASEPSGAQDELSLQASSVAGAWDVVLQNEARYTAFQMDVETDGAELDAELMAARAAGHTLMVNKTREGNYRVIGYSLSMSKFKGNEGALLRLKTEAKNVRVKNIIFTNSRLQSVYFDDLNSAATGIQQLEKTTEVEESPLYDLSGRRIYDVKNKKGVVVKKGKKSVQKN